LTHQRRVILELLADRRDHPSADQVFEAATALLPDLSRTTVYRVLEALVRIGLVRAVCHPGSSMRYEVVSDRHHHLVCRSCNRLFDFAAPRYNDLPLPRPRNNGFRVDDYSIQFRGLCADCSADADPVPSPGQARRRRRKPSS
jgi:Fur family peroxide stress response transcriptional regulator